MKRAKDNEIPSLLEVLKMVLLIPAILVGGGVLAYFIITTVALGVTVGTRLHMEYIQPIFDSIEGTHLPCKW